MCQGQESARGRHHPYRERSLFGPGLMSRPPRHHGNSEDGQTQLQSGSALQGRTVRLLENREGWPVWASIREEAQVGAAVPKREEGLVAVAVAVAALPLGVAALPARLDIQVATASAVHALA